MKRLLKWMGYAVAALLLIVLGLVIATTVLYDRKRNRVVTLDVKGVTVASDEATRNE